MTASRALVAIAARSLAAAGEVTLPQYRALVITALQAICEAAGETPEGDLDVGLGWY